MRINFRFTSFKDSRLFGSLLLIIFLPVASIATQFYYGMYKSYGTGDTVITTYHANGGSNAAHRKWQVECFDGEVATAVGDNIWDFSALTYVWCKFMFPFKPPTQGLYPYYPHCHVRDYLNQFFCYDRGNHSLTVNTVITGFWASSGNFVWWTDNIVRGVPPSTTHLPYKCCRTPRGYYVDYVSCYYVPTHDVYWEYYGGNFFLVQCATGYAMAGVGIALNPTTSERRLDWIQCCRIGWGAVIAVAPPIINVPNRPPAYTTSNLSPTSIPSGYAHQYRKKRSIENFMDNGLESLNNTVFAEDALTQREKMSVFDKKKLAEKYKGHVTHHDVPPILPVMNVPPSAHIS